MHEMDKKCALNRSAGTLCAHAILRGLDACNLSQHSRTVNVAIFIVQ